MVDCSGKFARKVTPGEAGMLLEASSLHVRIGNGCVVDRAVEGGERGGVDLNFSIETVVSIQSILSMLPDR